MKPPAAHAAVPVAMMKKPAPTCSPAPPARCRRILRLHSPPYLRDNCTALARPLLAELPLNRLAPPVLCVCPPFGLQDGKLKPQPVPASCQGRFPPAEAFGLSLACPGHPAVSDACHQAAAGGLTTKKERNHDDRSTGNNTEIHTQALHIHPTHVYRSGLWNQTQTT